MRPLFKRPAMVFSLAICLSLSFAEMLSRLLLPLPIAPIRTTDAESPFHFPKDVGYEIKPNAKFLVKSGSESTLEQMTRDGFRGPEIPVPKSTGTLRIALVGDSVVQGFSTSFADSWGEQLRRKIENSLGSKLRVEVINAGIGGYASWQVLKRFNRSVRKYHPDLVIVLCGWNDLLFSLASSWHPRINLVEFEKATSTPQELEEPRSGIVRFYRKAEQHVRFLYLIHQAKNVIQQALYLPRLVKRIERGNPRPLNQSALDNYRKNLNSIYQAVSSTRAAMAIVTWPTVVEESTFRDRNVHEKLLLYYQSFAESNRTLLSLHQVYHRTQLEFAQSHPRITLVDVVKLLEPIHGKARLALFTDHAHLTPAGNRIVAHGVFDGISPLLIRRDAVEQARVIK